MSSLRDDTLPVAIWGGTFDPVHNGHLRSALELADALAVNDLRLMPCANPPHRLTPATSAADRAAMLELAVARDQRLSCDRRELDRPGVSFTIDSLEQLRAELGETRSLLLVMGFDALLQVHSWHRYEDLLKCAHIVVVARPGWQPPTEGPVARWVAQHRSTALDELKRRPAGLIVFQELRPLPISASEIRALLAQGKSPQYLLPDAVLDYIFTNKLYTTEKEDTTG